MDPRTLAQKVDRLLAPITNLAVSVLLILGVGGIVLIIPGLLILLGLQILNPSYVDLVSYYLDTYLQSELKRTIATISFIAGGLSVFYLLAVTALVGILNGITPLYRQLKPAWRLTEAGITSEDSVAAIRDDQDANLKDQ